MGRGAWGVERGAWSVGRAIALAAWWPWVIKITLLSYFVFNELKSPYRTQDISGFSSDWTVR